MPGLPFDGHRNEEPTRDEVINYLNRYATERELPVQLSSRVGAFDRRDGGFAAEIPGGTILASQVIVATGPVPAAAIPRLRLGGRRQHVSDFIAPGTDGRATFRPGTGHRRLAEQTPVIGISGGAGRRSQSKCLPWAGGLLAVPLPEAAPPCVVVADRNSACDESLWTRA